MAKESKAGSSLTLERLLDLADGQPKEMRKLAQLYVRTLTAHLGNLDIAIEAAKPEAVERLAHNAAGSSAMVGMETLVSPLRTLERLGAKNDLRSARLLMAEIREAFAHICQFLESQHTLGKAIGSG
jgi:HPt (histidine-containing phosphotransfer) domain-containing protein